MIINNFVIKGLSHKECDNVAIAETLRHISSKNHALVLVKSYNRLHELEREYDTYIHEQNIKDAFKIREVDHRLDIVCKSSGSRISIRVVGSGGWLKLKPKQGCFTSVWLSLDDAGYFETSSLVEKYLSDCIRCKVPIITY